MCRMLLSINPEYVAPILSGKKRYEYRKRSCKRAVDRILIYSTHPVKKVVAEVDVCGIIDKTPEEVWEITKEYSGISKDFFDTYYAGRVRAIAFQLGTLHLFNPPLPLSFFGLSTAPQSFVYLPDGYPLFDRMQATPPLPRQQAEARLFREHRSTPSV